jgi:hypothetical protein
MLNSRVLIELRAGQAGKEIAHYHTQVSVFPFVASAGGS